MNYSILVVVEAIKIISERRNFVKNHANLIRVKYSFLTKFTIRYVCVQNACVIMLGRLFQRSMPHCSLLSYIFIDVCSLPAVQGPCEAHILRYFHNATASKCERFYYGGCLGNQNNFRTIFECTRRCRRSGNIFLWYFHSVQLML